jgi:hypothetical protein
LKSLKRTLTELKLLPPTPRGAGNHRSTHITLARSIALKLQQVPQAEIVLFQQLQARLILHGSCRNNPFTLG